MEKNSKGTNAILIFGCIFLIAGYVFASSYMYELIELFIEGNNLENGLGVALGLIFLLVPAFILGVIALILNIVAYKKTIKPCALWRKIPLILSIILPIICIGGYIATHFTN